MSRNDETRQLYKSAENESGTYKKQPGCYPAATSMKPKPNVNRLRSILPSYEPDAGDKCVQFGLFVTSEEVQQPITTEHCKIPVAQSYRSVYPERICVEIIINF